MNIELQPELNNQIKQEINSYYRILNVSQQGSLPSINGSKNQILIEIPADIVFNPSMLNLSFNLIHAGPSTTGKINALPSFYIPFFSRCELYSSSNNIRLVDVQNLDIYNKMSIPLYENFLKNQESYLYTSNRTTNTVNTPLTSDYFVDSNVVSDKLLTYDVSLVGTVDTVISPKSYNIKLCDLIPNSFFSINKNIYSSSVLYLRLETNTIANIMYLFDSNALTTTSPDTASSFTFSNFNLNIFCEANNDLINIARQQQNSKEGMSLVLPEIQNAQYSLSGTAGTRGSIVKVVNNSSSDARLYMVISSLTSTLQKTGSYVANNMSNNLNAKYNQVQLYINSNLLCQFDTALNQDLSYIDNVFENHSFNTQLSYKNVSPYVYVFTSKKIKDNKHDGNLLDGITYPVNGEITLNIIYNCIAPDNSAPHPTGNNFNHNIYTVTKRKIYLKDGKFSYVPFG